MKRILVVLFTLCLLLSFLNCGNSDGKALDRNAAMQRNSNIKNIIVMIPDGTSVGGIALARWCKSYNPTDNSIDPSVMLTIDELTSGLVRTWWTNGETIGAIVDSAPAGTAYASGIKTTDKFIGMTPASTPFATILEAAKLIGKSTGMIATSNIQHATPAAFSSHHNDRSRYDIIGEQQAYNNIDVVLGGGSMYLTPPYRQDGEDIIEEIKSMGYQFITTKSELSTIKNGRVWGMFADDAMAYDIDRKENAPTEPSLSEMTTKAIELLSQNKNGFFLMVEASKTDWAAHANDPVGLVSDLLAFDAAVKVALDFAKSNKNTMILIMSDHGTGGLTIGNNDAPGYSSDPIQKYIAPIIRAALSGEGVAAKFNENRTNIIEVMSQYFGINDLTSAELTVIRNASGSMNSVVGPMISRRAFLGWTTNGHTGEEVNLFTYLPGNGRITGTIENTDIAKICAGVWGIDLNVLTNQLYIDAENVFVSKGASVVIDTSIRSSGTMTVTKGDTTLLIPENKNYVIRNDQRVNIKSVIVNQSGRFFVPQEVIDMIK